VTNEGSRHHRPRQRAAETSASNSTGQPELSVSDRIVIGLNAHDLDELPELAFSHRAMQQTHARHCAS
jgi:hypothetical protein